MIIRDHAARTRRVEYISAATRMNPRSSTTTETERAPRSLHDILPPYSVILHNDDVHSMDFVVAALVKSVASLTVEEATTVMLEAHDKGQAVVITCPLEQAELYRDRLRSFSLGVTIEKA